MSDEAFARRFYSDRAELVGARRPARLAARRVHRRGALHAPLRALLPAAARARRRRARGAPDLPLPARGTVRLRRAAAARAAEPRARPLGRAARRRRRRRPPCASRCAIPTTRPSSRAGSASSRRAISKQRTIRFRYWSIARDDERERTINPYALLPENGTWYVIGQDQEDNVVKNFRVSRIRSEIRFATRRERDFRVPDELRRRGVPRPRRVAVRRHRRRGADRGRARHRLVGAARVRRRRATASRTTCSSPSTRRCRCSPAGSCARTAARSRSSRPRCAGSSIEGVRAARRAHEGAAARAGRRARTAPGARRRPSARPGPVAPERFGVLQSLLAYLLAACGEEREAVIPAQRARRALLDPARGARGAPVAAEPRQLRRRLLRRLRRAARRRGARRQGALRRHVPPGRRG